MSFTPHNFKSGDILYASQMNSIERAIMANDQVTPEDFGAYGDGVHDDAPAIKQALESGHPVSLTKNLFIFSPIVIRDHNVVLNGNGFTIRADMNNIMTTPSGNDYDILTFIATGRTYVDDFVTPLRRVYDTKDVHINELIGRDTEGGADLTDVYKIGYLSYKGHKPLPKKWLDMMDDSRIVIDAYYPIQVIVRDLNLELNRCRGRYAIQLNNLCNSSLHNVNVVSVDGEGQQGIAVNVCYNMLIDHVHVENIWAEYTWMQPSVDPIYGRGNNGYALSASGDNIFIRNFTGWNTKSNLTVAGNRTIWTTNLIVDGMHVGYDVVREDVRRSIDGRYSTNRYESAFNCHEDAICPILANITVDMMNSQYRHAGLSIRCPEAIIDNVAINAPEGSINSYGLNQMLHLNNVDAPNITLDIGLSNPDSIYGRMSGSTFLANQVIASNCHLFRVNNGATWTTVKLDNCFIEQYVWNIQHLVMNNTTVHGYTPQEWPGMISVIILGEAQITGCQIYQNRSEYVSRTTPVIKAPNDEVHMVNTKIYKHNQCRIFKNGNTQTHLTEVWTEDVLGLIFDDWNNGYWDNFNWL